MRLTIDPAWEDGVAFHLRTILAQGATLTEPAFAGFARSRRRCIAHDLAYRRGHRHRHRRRTGQRQRNGRPRRAGRASPGMTVRLGAFTDLVAERALARAATNPAGPLAGVPFAVKNLFDVAGLPTRAGSAINRGRAAARRTPMRR